MTLMKFQSGAIKFGERLSLSDCQQLINMVAKCKLPFCCAHGRPSVIPLVDLAEVQEITSEVQRKNEANLTLINGSGLVLIAIIFSIQTSPQHRLKKLSLQMKAAL